MKSFADLALTLCRQVADRRGMAFSRALLGERTGNAHANRCLLEQSLNEFHNLGDAWGEAWVAIRLAGIFVTLGMQDDYFAISQQAIACARLSGDRELIAAALIGSARDWLSEGNWKEAETILQEVEHVSTQIPSSYGIHETRFYRARLLMGRGQPEAAKAEATRSFEYFRQAGEKNLQAKSLLLLGLIAEFEHDLPSAVAYIQTGVDVLQEMAGSESIWWRLALARLYDQQGQWPLAKQCARESFTMMKSGVMERTESAYVLYHLARLLLEKKPALAIRLLALAAAMRQRLSFLRDPSFDKPFYERFTAAGRAKLGEADFAIAWASGAQMCMEEAEALALSAFELT